MAIRTPREERALAWFCEHNQCMPQMSTYPIYRFKCLDGSEIKENIRNIVAEWEGWKKEEKKKKGA